MDKMNDNEKINANFDKLIVAFEKESGADALKNDFASILQKVGGNNDGEAESTSYIMLGILSNMAEKDGKLTDGELHFIARIFPNLDVKKIIYHFMLSPIDISYVTKRLNKNQLTIIYILAWQTALADGVLHESEKKYLESLKEQFQLEDEGIREYKTYLLSKVLGG